LSRTSVQTCSNTSWFAVGVGVILAVGATIGVVVGGATVGVVVGGARVGVVVGGARVRVVVGGATVGVVGGATVGVVVGGGVGPGAHAANNTIANGTVTREFLTVSSCG
jgi:hypothetical protein